MILDSGLLVLAAIGFLAYAVRGVSGAASAIVFNALFGVAFVLGLTGDLTLLDGLYWVALADLLANGVMVFKLRAEMVWEPFVRRMLIFTIPVSIVFVLALPWLDVQLLTLGLGATLVVSGLYLGMRQTIGVWSEEALRRRAAPTGVAAGLLAGLYGMPGPVFMIYLIHAGTDTARFRVRSTAISSVLTLVRAVTLLVSGAISAEALLRFGVTVPIVFVGLGVGMWLHPKVGPRAFRFGLGLIIMVAGAVLLLRTLSA